MNYDLIPGFNPQNCLLINLNSYYNCSNHSNLTINNLVDNLDISINNNNLVISIPAQTTIANPIYLVNQSIDKINNPFKFNLTIDIGNNSNCKIIDHKHSQNNATTINCQAQSKLEYYLIQNMDNSRLTIEQQTNSNLAANILANSLTKNQLQLTANLLAPQSNLDLSILQNTKKQASHIIDLLINHLTTDSRSNSISRAIAADQSIANLTGQVVVHKSSANTEAHLQSKSLILSKQGAIKSCPELVIENDDVICTHGSSIGNLDQAALYYMQTRGMTLPQAKEILIQAFLNPILDKLACDPIKNYFN